MNREPNDAFPDAVPAEDPRETAWYRFALEIDDLLATGEFTWAETRLEQIAAAVRLTERVTDQQRTIVRNIEAAPEQMRYRSRHYWGTATPHRRLR